MSFSSSFYYKFCFSWSSAKLGNAELEPPCNISVGVFVLTYFLLSNRSSLQLRFLSELGLYLPWVTSTPCLVRTVELARRRLVVTRRRRATSCFTVPAQQLNACGSNHLSDADLPGFWKVLAQGNKSVPFFHEGVLRSTAPGCRRVPRCWGYPVVRDGRAVGFTLHMSSRIHF